MLSKIVNFGGNIKRITTEDIAPAAEYKFKITPKNRSFDNVREQYYYMRGDLTTINMLPQGEKHFELVNKYKIVTNSCVIIKFLEYEFIVC